MVRLAIESGETTSVIPGTSVTGDPDERLNESDLSAHAYELWQDRDCPIGSPDVDWFRAAEDLRIPLAAERC